MSGFQQLAPLFRYATELRENHSIFNVNLELLQNTKLARTYRNRNHCRTRCSFWAFSVFSLSSVVAMSCSTVFVFSCIPSNSSNKAAIADCLKEQKGFRCGYPYRWPRPEASELPLDILKPKARGSILVSESLNTFIIPFSEVVIPCRLLSLVALQ